MKKIFVASSRFLISTNKGGSKGADDDGETFDYEKGAYSLCEIKVENKNGTISDPVKGKPNTMLEQIAVDLQSNLPGLKGFSFTNLKKMRQFYETYSELEIRPSATAQIENPNLAVQQKEVNLIGPLATT